MDSREMVSQQTDLRLISWNSTYQMLSWLHDEKEPVWVSVASLPTDLTPLAADECDIVTKDAVTLI